MHILIKGRGSGDMKYLKEESETIYSENEMFEDTVLEVADCSKDSTGKISFKIKEDYLQWFDPYFYLNPESQAKILEVTSSLFKDK